MCFPPIWLAREGGKQPVSKQGSYLNETYAWHFLEAGLVADFINKLLIGDKDEGLLKIELENRAIEVCEAPHRPRRKAWVDIWQVSKKTEEAFGRLRDWNHLI
jgi:hypothetical protein